MTPITIVQTDPEPQHLRALKSANHVRAERLALRRDTAALPRPASRTRVAGMLENPPDCILTMEVGRLLRWGRGIGASCARSLLARADSFAPIGATRRIGDLTERQRYALADAVYQTRGGSDG